MKKQNFKLLYLVLPLCFIAFIYLLFSFSFWEFNPSRWSYISRSFSAFLSFMVIVLSVGIIISIEN